MAVRLSIRMSGTEDLSRKSIPFDEKHRLLSLGRTRGKFLQCDHVTF
jgi:hypothetical protein